MLTILGMLWGLTTALLIILMLMVRTYNRSVHEGMKEVGQLFVHLHDEQEDQHHKTRNHVSRRIGEVKTRLADEEREDQARKAKERMKVLKKG